MDMILSFFHEFISPWAAASPASQIVMEDKELKEGEDFYFDPNGLMVLTAEYLKKRGYCCESGCRHCPYGFKKGLPAKPPFEKESE